VPAAFFEERTITVKRVSLKEVAKHAGVSTGTVSMVLNDNPSVASKTRSRVKQAIAELGYIYNCNGAQLRKKRKGIVGISICNPANPYFSEVMVGIDEALGELGFALILGHAGESIAQQNKFLNLAREHNVDGLIHEIKRPDLIEVINRIERRDALTIARFVRSWLRQVFRYALVKVELEYNPATSITTH
jgi:DNA-binding LacI/PurR family transcriptional regulator